MANAPVTPFKEQGKVETMSGQEPKLAPSLHTPSQQTSKQAALVVEEAAHLDTGDILSPLSTQFSTPSPYPARAKRSRSAASAGAAACFGASPPSAQPCWTDFHARTAAAASLSPVTAFPRLDEDDNAAADTAHALPPRAASRAQRDLFGGAAPDLAAAPGGAPDLAAAPSGVSAAPKPRRGVVNFGELVAEGLALQRAAAALGEYASGAYADSSTEEDEDEPDDTTVVLAARRPMPAVADQWLHRAVSYYSGTGKENTVSPYE